MKLLAFILLVMAVNGQLQKDRAPPLPLVQADYEQGCRMIRNRPLLPPRSLDPKQTKDIS